MPSSQMSEKFSSPVQQQIFCLINTIRVFASTLSMSTKSNTTIIMVKLFHNTLEHISDRIQ